MIRAKPTSRPFVHYVGLTVVVAIVVYQDWRRVAFNEYSYAVAMTFVSFGHASSFVEVCDTGLLIILADVVLECWLSIVPNLNAIDTIVGTFVVSSYAPGRIQVSNA